MGFVFFASLTVTNLLVGLLVEAVGCLASVEKEANRVKHAKDRLEHILTFVDENNDGFIERDEFEELLTNSEAARALQEVGVDVVGLLDFGEFLFEGDTKVPYEQFTQTILALRGSNSATVKDIVDMRKWLSEKIASFEENVCAVLPDVKFGRRDSVP